MRFIVSSYAALAMTLTRFKLALSEILKCVSNLAIAPPCAWPRFCNGVNHLRLGLLAIHPPFSLNFKTQGRYFKSLSPLICVTVQLASVPFDLIFWPVLGIRNFDSSYLDKDISKGSSIATSCGSVIAHLFYCLRNRWLRL